MSECARWSRCDWRKSYRLWGTDLNAENTVLEAGLGRFVRLNKGSFAGRDSLVLQQEAGIPTRFCTIEIEAEDADAFGNEPVLLDGTVIGRGTAEDTATMSASR